MIKRFLATAVNVSLLFIFVGMLVLPVAMVYVASDALHVPATVAAAKDIQSKIAVLPNFFDFSDHVSFNLEQSPFGYLDSLELTSFRSQVATYHKVYTVFNRSNEVVTVRGILTEKPEPAAAYRQLLITMAKTGQAHEAVVVSDVQEGDISMLVSDASLLEHVSAVVVDGTVLPVLSANGKVLSTDPVTQPIAAKTAIYRDGILVQDGKVYQSRTEAVALEPGESLSINIVVTGKKDVDSQTITVPFLITTVEE